MLWYASNINSWNTVPHSVHAVHWKKAEGPICQTDILELLITTSEILYFKTVSAFISTYFLVFMEELGEWMLIKHMEHYWHWLIVILNADV